MFTIKPRNISLISTTVAGDTGDCDYVCFPRDVYDTPNFLNEVKAAMSVFGRASVTLTIVDKDGKSALETMYLERKLISR